MRFWKKAPLVLLLGLALAYGGFGLVFAAQSSSSSYQVNEVFFGAGGELNSCSSSYCSKQSLGETAVGNTQSANFQAQAGFNTDRSPYIEFQVSNTNLDLGVLSASSTKTANATFSVKTYLSSGYIVQTMSDPPTNNSYVMQGLASPTASAVGQEQFGINLVANTSPTTFGANPSQNPSTAFSFGTVATGYDTPNLFKYIRGDTVAYATKSTGETDYTVSYIFNVSNLTPGGTFLLRHVLVATATF